MKRYNQGFSLIELMVVLVLVAMLLVGVSTLLLSNLRGGGKATLIANLRDEGEAAMLAMERELRFGVSPVCSELDVGDEINFILRRWDENVHKYVEKPISYQLAGNIIERSDQKSGTNFINYQRLLGGDALSISVNNKLFACEHAGTSFESTNVSIAFMLRSDEDSEVSQGFTTTISMRNKE